MVRENGRLQKVKLIPMSPKKQPVGIAPAEEFLVEVSDLVGTVVENSGWITAADHVIMR